MRRDRRMDRTIWEYYAIIHGKIKHCSSFINDPAFGNFSIAKRSAGRGTEWEDLMKRSTRSLFRCASFLFALIALACSCFSSGTISSAPPPTSGPTAGIPAVTAAIPPETTPEASAESGTEPTVKQSPAFPALKDMGRIVFNSVRNNGLSDIYLMNADGSEVQFLAGDPGYMDLGAAWSPRGEWIAFIGSGSQHTFDILRVRADGSDLSNLTETPADESAFDWSPDGSQIVFQSDRGGNYDLYVMDADGANVRQLTRTGNVDEVEPAWSPDGETIACLCGPKDANMGDICIMNADGSGQTNLTEDDPDITEFAWSPDGSRLAFGMPLWPEEIWMMDADGSDRQNLTNDPADDGGLAFSPDGTMIAFSSDRAGKKKQIFLMRADGSHVVQLTDNGLANFRPGWSPDGSWIVFISAVSSGEFDSEIYVVRIDGSGLTNLTSDPAQDLGPDWEPF
jgi:Tol biopolymer transport system component